MYLPKVPGLARVSVNRWPGPKRTGKRRAGKRLSVEARTHHQGFPRAQSTHTPSPCLKCSLRGQFRMVEYQELPQRGQAGKVVLSCAQSKSNVERDVAHTRARLSATSQKMKSRSEQPEEPSFRRKSRGCIGTGSEGGGRGSGWWMRTVKIKGQALDPKLRENKLLCEGQLKSRRDVNS